MAMCLSLSATVILFCLFFPKLRVVLLKPNKNVRSKSSNLVKSVYNNKNSQHSKRFSLTNNHSTSNNSQAHTNDNSNSNTNNNNNPNSQKHAQLANAKVEKSVTVATNVSSTLSSPGKSSYQLIYPKAISYFFQIQQVLFI
jgi:hypothetical protein